MRIKRIQDHVLRDKRTLVSSLREKNEIRFIENGDCPSNGESAGGAVYEGVMSVRLGIPLLIQRGGCGFNKMSRSLLSAADGMVWD